MRFCRSRRELAALLDGTTLTKAMQQLITGDHHIISPVIRAILIAGL